MRLIALFACLFLTAAAPKPLPTLTPAQAISQAAAASPAPVRALFELKVARAAKAGDGYYLDSETDFRSPTNLAIAIRASAMAGLTKKYGDDLRSAFVGKTVRVVGEVRRLTVGKTHSATATQVEVTSAGQILSVSSAKVARQSS